MCKVNKTVKCEQRPISETSKNFIPHDKLHSDAFDIASIKIDDSKVTPQETELRTVIG